MTNDVSRRWEHYLGAKRSAVLGDVVVVAGFDVALGAVLVFLGVGGVALFRVDAAGRGYLLVLGLVLEAKAQRDVAFVNWLLEARFLAARGTWRRYYHLE